MPLDLSGEWQFDGLVLACDMRLDFTSVVMLTQTHQTQT